MSGYRSGTGCELCEEISVTYCARCMCAVCAAHEGTPYCAACQREAKEEMEIAAFREAVNVPQREKQPVFPSQSGLEDTQILAAIVGWLGRLVFRQRAPTEVPFAKRSPEAIREWRRKAGMRLRTR